jgi:hypothetical protein
MAYAGKVGKISLLCEIRSITFKNREEMANDKQLIYPSELIMIKYSFSMFSLFEDLCLLAFDPDILLFTLH